ncbi:hypothetical protein G6F29_011487 [Rhizopus arrhizus]|uniref:RRM domain-containing protein n=1 Tax=Rhizopus oryzae TaxID=64495 RepID=A0A9P7BMY6_RHIOR|nr:hypothetical protein G6F24_010914 [Rhizopus arrhizus]KAG0895820.1 hypothetical protein G6F34_007900 [Rhizopus arrhizus]KAG0906067.1 hypothetical protein G6F33_011669 [Rhizopus arrhizus]KAG0931037.1 hypothetical protein G6F30_011367 [Rhizopus arrhizus]KAG0975502.1 hypothetical protein G6F29_011487 [Rhizopus arrhizus]
MPADRKGKDQSNSAYSSAGGYQGSEYDYSNYYGYGYDYSTGTYTDPNASTADYSQYYSQYYDPQAYYDSTATTTAKPMSAAAASSSTASSYKPSSTVAAAGPSAYTPVSSGTTTTSASGVKTYYPNQSNPNNPVGPVIITKSGYSGPSGTTGSSSSSSSYNDKKKKKKNYVRVAGGEVWEDPTLADWDDQDYRLFAGDLGNEVTEELLFKTFSKYPSLTRTRVVRDSRTMKSKGFGFISFKDPDDFVRAWREMNGKYVGNRPIKLRKSTWKERNIEVKAKKEKERMGPYSKLR